MWGVYEFKRGFKGEVRRHIGAWDYAPNLLRIGVIPKPFPASYARYAESADESL
jgi:hypothetical protein